MELALVTSDAAFNSPLKHTRTPLSRESSLIAVQIDAAKLDFNDEWYWGSDFSCGDLYEAEEVYRSGGTFTPNRLIFVHFPDGKVVDRLPSRSNT